jgi:hypothetical protein
MKRTPLQLAEAQLDGGEALDDGFPSNRCVCQNCGVEFCRAYGLGPCAFCNGCKDIVLDHLAKTVVGLRASLPRSKR